MNQNNRLLPPGLRLLLLASFLWGATGSTAVWAQADNDAAWYQVEMIIFARPGADDGIEQWPRNIQLHYPFNWVELQDPDQPPAPAGDSASRERGEFSAVQAPEPEAAPAQYDPDRDPFIELPRSERRLNAHATSINRRDAYRVLFHERWRQPVLAQSSAPAILITGGEQFGHHYELEGSISLSLSRYLHLHTRLWLTEFEPNFGQPPGAWPELPQRPNQARVIAEPLQESPWQGAWGDSRTSSWDMGLNGAASQPDFLGKDFLPNRIATLTQQRRMRSKELHYLDHPLFGILVEIRPYTPPADEVATKEENDPTEAAVR